MALTILLFAGAALPPAAIAAEQPASLVFDGFDRTVDDGWGLSSTGLRYTDRRPAGTSLKVQSGRALIEGLGPGQSVAVNIADTLSQDADLLSQVTLTMPLTQSFSFHQAWEMRQQADGDSYRGRLEFGSGGRVTLAVSRDVDGRDVNLGRVALPFSAVSGHPVNVAFRVTGTTTVRIGAKAWPDGQREPEDALSLLDSSSDRIAVGGTTGIWQYASSGNGQAINSAFDYLYVNAVPPSPAPVPVPAPVPAPVPVPTPAPAPVPANNGTRGAVDVGLARYPIAAAALFVDGTNGRMGATGTESTPLQTLDAAVSRARNGQTIILRRGIYNESVEIPFEKSLIIQAYPGEAVWLDGTVKVSNWTKSGSVWLSSNWVPEFSDQIDGIASNPRFVAPTSNMASHPDLLFKDGVQLKQVSSAAQVVPGTFAVDDARNLLILGDDPLRAEIRASNKSRAIKVLSPNTVLRGFGVRGYATSYEQRAAVQIVNVGARVENLVIQDNAMIGLTLQNDNALVERVTVRRNGMMGIGVNAAYGSVVRNSMIVENNLEQFKTAPVAGGIKVTRSRDVTISNSDTSHNSGTGIWLDESVYDAKIFGNTSSFNRDIGIEIELSDRATVASNETIGQDTGILIYNSSNVRALNNTIGANRTFGLKLAQDRRRQGDRAFVGQDPRRPFPDTSMTWITSNIVISNNVFGAGGLFQVYGLDGETNRSMDSMNVTITGNLFNRRMDRSQATMVAWGQSDNHTLVRYETPQDLAQAKNLQWRNALTTRSLPVESMGSDVIAAAALAVPLSQDVAALIGQPVGVRKVGQF